MAGRVGVRKRVGPRKRYSRRNPKKPLKRKVGYYKKTRETVTKNGHTHTYIRYWYDKEYRRKWKGSKPKKTSKTQKTSKWTRVKRRLKKQLGKNYKKTNWYSMAKRKYKKRKK